MKEYMTLTTYNYLKDNIHENSTQATLKTCYDESNQPDELKLSINLDIQGHSVTNYIYLDVDFADELIHTLVMFKKDVQRVQFERSSK